MRLSWQKIQLKLKETFSISYGNYNSREALVITLVHKGFSGYGECTEIDYYGIKLDDFVDKLQQIKKAIENQYLVYPTEFYEVLLKFKLPTFLTSALDCAYWDLYGKLEGKSFIEMNQIPIENIPESSITISVASLEAQIQKIENSNWSKFKVKGNGLDKKNLEILAQLPYDIALDSNGSFTQEDCLWIENEPLSSAFTYLEQPMKPGLYKALSTDKYANWMADEDCQNELNLRSLLNHYKSINVKLVKCGGLTPAMALIKNAKAIGFKVMIGCMTESTIGISAAANVAPLVDYADLDGANLISNDIAKGSQIINGKIEISDRPGLGISLL